MVAWAFAVNWVMSEPYSIVSFCDMVLLMAMPLELTTIIPLRKHERVRDYLDTLVSVDSVDGFFNFLTLKQV